MRKGVAATFLIVLTILLFTSVIGYNYFSSHGKLYYLNGGGGGGTSSPDFSVSVSPASRSIGPAQSASYTITLTSINGFKGYVDFTLYSPNGIAGQNCQPETCSFSVKPVFIPAYGSATTVFTISTSPLYYKYIVYGTYTTYIKATYGGLSHQVATYLTIAPVKVVSSALPAATAGQLYSYKLVASGGTAPYTWNRVYCSALGLVCTLEATPDSNFIPGLTFYGDGTLSGTPTGPGYYTFKVNVCDKGTPQLCSQGNIGFTVNPAPTLTITTTSLPNTDPAKSYYAKLSATGGLSPYHWSGDPFCPLIGSCPPAYLKINDDGTITGKVEIGDALQTYTFNVYVKDSGSLLNQQVASKKLSITLNPFVITTNSPLPSAYSGSYYSTTLTATGAVPPYTWKIVGLCLSNPGSACLPPGISISGTTGQISGTAVRTGTYTFTVRVLDSTGSYCPVDGACYRVDKTFTLTVY